jgi:hypothetical protein
MRREAVDWLPTCSAGAQQLPTAVPECIAIHYGLMCACNGQCVWLGPYTHSVRACVGMRSLPQTWAIKKSPMASLSHLRVALEWSWERVPP